MVIITIRYCYPMSIFRPYIVCEKRVQCTLRCQHHRNALANKKISHFNRNVVSAKSIRIWFDAHCPLPTYCVRKWEKKTRSSHPHSKTPDIRTNWISDALFTLLFHLYLHYYLFFFPPKFVKSLTARRIRLEWNRIFPIQSFGHWSCSEMGDLQTQYLKLRRIIWKKKLYGTLEGFLIIKLIAVSTFLIRNF